MDAADFSKTWSEFGDERRRLIDRRTDLENELAEVRHKISHLDEVLNHLAPLADLPFYDDDDFLNLGITDAVRFILKHATVRMSGMDVRQELTNRNYDLSSMTAQMASIYKILSRLVAADEIEREKVDGKVFYTWKQPMISDDDIPF